MPPPVDPPAPFHPTATRRVRTTVQVGVGVVVCCGSKLYAGVRKGSHGANTLALPGGHLEVYESWEDCAIREVKEEMDIQLTDVEFAHVTNNIMPEEEKHYVTILMMGRLQTDSKGPTNTEPDKCEGWNLYSWNELKAMQGTGRLFGPLERLVEDSPSALVSFLTMQQHGI
jgi:8-oxo-dGTP diphosphatase